MVKIQKIKRDSPVYNITLTKEVISATEWKEGDVINEIVLNKNEVLLKKDD